MDPLYYFEDFLSIPRESGNEKEISDYLVKFATEHNLEYYRDDSNNVIIKKKSNKNSVETIALQGHIDMVCTSIRDFDFKNNGIDWYIEDGYYKANGTTLGADNGIWCSLILSVLSNDNISIPNIEAVFTTSEETNMNGAKRLDYSKITSNKFISIDGTDEGVIDVSSAGMISFNVDKKINYIKNNMPTYKIKVSGLKGGHSGIDIDKNNGNAIEIMFNLLEQLNNYNVVSIKGGVRYNVIPSTCECIIATNDKLNFDYSPFDMYKELNISVEQIKTCAKVINNDDFDEIKKVMHTLPKGVVTYCGGYPQSSVNLAIIETSYEHISLKISLRSSNKIEEQAIIYNIKNICKLMSFEIVDTVPFFEYNKNSKLIKVLTNKYYQLFSKNVVLNHVHAGLEGGIFAEKINNLDMCVIAPNLSDIHTVDEKVEIDSVNRVYKWLISVLESI